VDNIAANTSEDGPASAGEGEIPPKIAGGNISRNDGSSLTASSEGGICLGFEATLGLEKTGRKVGVVGRAGPTARAGLPRFLGGMLCGCASEVTCHMRVHVLVQNANSILYYDI
jgi:hypothetical protein